MPRYIHPQQMEGWVAKLQSNMQQHIDQKIDDKEKQLSFIRHQYHLMDTTLKVLNGTAQLVGCSHPPVESRIQK